MRFSLKAKAFLFSVGSLAVVTLLTVSGALNPLLPSNNPFTLNMPGESYSGDLPPLRVEEMAIKEGLYQHIDELASKIGERNLRRYENLKRAEDYIASQFRSLGYDAQYQDFTVSGKTVRNIEATLHGKTKPEEILILGAHYDSAHTPAANDNGSGVAAMLELARILKNVSTDRTIRFVAFVNEEPPYFQTTAMGSYVYAKRSHEREENIVGAYSLETMGYYSDAPDSQHYPFPLSLFYPDTGNFIGFVGNAKSKALITEAVRIFRDHTQFPSEGAAITEYVSGVGWSDHWAFWQFGYQALMITDTAPFRYPYYHTAEDTIDKINFDKMTRVVHGLSKTFTTIANQP